MTLPPTSNFGIVLHIEIYFPENWVIQCVCIHLVAWCCLHSQWSKYARIMLSTFMIMRVRTKRSGMASASGSMFRSLQSHPAKFQHMLLYCLLKRFWDLYVMKFWNHRKKAFPLVFILGCIYLDLCRLTLGLVSLLLCCHCHLKRLIRKWFEKWNASHQPYPP